MAKPRVHQIAKQHKVRAADILTLLELMGEPARTPSTVVAPPVAKRIDREFSDYLSRVSAALATYQAKPLLPAVARKERRAPKRTQPRSVAAKPTEVKLWPIKSKKATAGSPIRATINVKQGDADYRAALRLGGSRKLPRALGSVEGHGGAQPQVKARKRNTKFVLRRR